MNYRRASPAVSDFSMKNLSIDRKFIILALVLYPLYMPSQMNCRYLSRGKPRGIKPTPSNNHEVKKVEEVESKVAVPKLQFWNSLSLLKGV
jgi:hypothetical protein